MARSGAVKVDGKWHGIGRRQRVAGMAVSRPLGIVVAFAGHVLSCL
jgi:hypothetical protein